MRIPFFDPVNHQFAIATKGFPGGTPRRTNLVTRHFPLSKVLLALWQSGPRRRENSFPEIDKVGSWGRAGSCNNETLGYVLVIYIYV
jgi:hypothetical protein